MCFNATRRKKPIRSWRFLLWLLLYSLSSCSRITSSFCGLTLVTAVSVLNVSNARHERLESCCCFWSPMNLNQWACIHPFPRCYFKEKPKIFLFRACTSFPQSVNRNLGTRFRYCCAFRYVCGVTHSVVGPYVHRIISLFTSLNICRITYCVILRDRVFFSFLHLFSPIDFPRTSPMSLRKSKLCIYQYI